MKLNWFDLEVVTHMGLPDMQISMKSSLFCLEMSKCCHNANILLVGTSTSNVIVLRTIFGTEKNQQKRLWFIYLFIVYRFAFKLQEWMQYKIFFCPFCPFFQIQFHI